MIDHQRSQEIPYQQQYTSYKPHLKYHTPPKILPALRFTYQPTTPPSNQFSTSPPPQLLQSYTVYLHTTMIYNLLYNNSYIFSFTTPIIASFQPLSPLPSSPLPIIHIHLNQSTTIKPPPSTHKPILPLHRTQQYIHYLHPNISSSTSPFSSYFSISICFSSSLLTIPYSTTYHGTITHTRIAT